MNLNRVNGSADNYTVNVYNMSYAYRVQLTQLYALAKVVIDNDRVHLEDSPYDMFCIPYSDELQLKNNYNKRNETPI